MATIGETDYRDGAKERLEESYILLREERFGGSVYLAGRAVEGMLRGLIWKSDPDYRTGRKSLETGHDLRGLLKLVLNLGVALDSEDAMFVNVQHVARLWTNNMRFLSTGRVEKEWLSLHEIGGRRSIKRAVQGFYDACVTIIKRCEALWKS